MPPRGPWPSTTHKRKTPCGPIYVTVRAKGGRRDFSLHLGKAGGCVGAHMHVASKLSELALEHGASLEEVMKILKGNGCHLSSEQTPSCISAIADVIEEVTGKKHEKN